MVAHLRGVLDRITQDSLILDVNGIGFRVFTATGTLAEVGIGETVRVFTHTYVREDILALYGFLTEGELRMFEQLLAVSGVGPKAALALISAVSPSAFGLAVLTEDADRLTKAQGIGKKTAQRIILELKDKIKKELSAFGVVSGTVQSTHEDVPEGIFGEAAGALMMLGYTASEAQKSVSAVMEDGKPLESVIRDALKMRGRIF
jgi:holliday junction DNA helicase RuvA